MAAPPNIRLELASRPENVVLVRETLAGLSEAIRLDGGDLNDIRTAVTEACNNVVLHAYEGAEGPLEVEIFVADEALVVSVRDRGIGLPTLSDSDEWVVGIGLPVIRALVRTVDFLDMPTGGTEVRMEFATPGARSLDPLADDGFEPPVLAGGALAHTTSVMIAPVSPLARTVLPRLMGVLAARAHFRTDRISDALLLADALGAHTPASVSAPHLSVAVDVQPRSLGLRLAPIGIGLSERLVSHAAVDGLGSVIERLSDHQSIDESGSHETLELRLIDPR